MMLRKTLKKNISEFENKEKSWEKPRDGLLVGICTYLGSNTPGPPHYSWKKGSLTAQGGLKIAGFT